MDIISFLLSKTDTVIVFGTVTLLCSCIVIGQTDSESYLLFWTGAAMNMTVAKRQTQKKCSFGGGFGEKWQIEDAKHTWRSGEYDVVQLFIFYLKCKLIFYFYYSNAYVDLF